MVAWLHIENRGLLAAVAGAAARAHAGAWASDEASVADLRALILGTYEVVNLRLVAPTTTTEPAPPPYADPTTVFGDVPPSFRSAWDAQVCTALLGTWMVLARGRVPAAASFRTESGGEPTTEPIEAAVWPLVVVKLAGIAAATVAACYIAEKAMPIIDRELSRSSEAKKIVGTQAGLLGLVRAHHEREQAFGMSLPPDPVEQAALAALLSAQAAYQKSAVEPAPPPKEPPPLSSSIASSVSLATVAAVAIVAYLVLQKGS